MKCQAVRHTGVRGVRDHQYVIRIRHNCGERAAHVDKRTDGNGARTVRRQKVPVGAA